MRWDRCVAVGLVRWGGTGKLCYVTLDERADGQVRVAVTRRTLRERGGKAAAASSVCGFCKIGLPPLP